MVKKENKLIEKLKKIKEQERENKVIKLNYKRAKKEILKYIDKGLIEKEQAVFELSKKYNIEKSFFNKILKLELEERGNKERQNTEDKERIKQEKLKKKKEIKKEEETENTIKDSEIKKALIQSKIPVQRLGQGVHNNIFYYGTTLIYENKPISAIVTSNKKLYLGLTYINWKCNACNYSTEKIQPSYETPKPPKNCSCDKISYQDWTAEEITNPIKNEFGLNYRTEFNEDAIDYVWQTEDIKKYLKGSYIKTDCVSDLKRIYKNLLEINKKYIDHLNPASHKYITCWNIATYCYTLFEQFGRLYQRAERGSGKTKQSRVIKFVSFNPMWITKGTESSIFRDAEATCGTFIVDNMDKLHEELKRSMEHLIETGWMYDSTYRLTDKDTGRTQKFLSYTPMDINNIYGLDDNTIDKTFEIQMLKSINKNIQRIKPTHKSEDWNYHRNSIRHWVLDNWEEILKNYNKINAKFSGREFDVVEGVLTIAKMIGKQEFEEIEDYVKEKIEEEMMDLESNKSYMIFSKIWKQFQGDALELKVFLKDIADELFPSFYPNLKEDTKDYNDKKRNFSKYIGKIIRGVPMFRKSGLSNGRTYILIQKKDLDQYMKLQRFIDEEGVLVTEKEAEPKGETPENPSDEKEAEPKGDAVLLSSTTSTTSTSSLSSTPIFNKKVEQGEQVEQVEQSYEVEQNIKKDAFSQKELKEVQEEFS